MKNLKFEEEIRKQIGGSVDTTELDREYDGLYSIKKAEKFGQKDIESRIFSTLHCVISFCGLRTYRR